MFISFISLRKSIKKSDNFQTVFDAVLQKWNLEYSVETH